MSSIRIIHRFAFSLIVAFFPAGIIAHTLMCDKSNDWLSKDILSSSKSMDIAPEPTTQPANLTFSNVMSYTYDLAFSHANPQPDGYIVLRSINQAVIASPVDGSRYYPGDAIGNARVVYVGGDVEFSPSGVIAGTTFYHSIFSFNGADGNENYLTTNPLTGSVTTPSNMIEDYYHAVNSNIENFIEVLQNTIRPHNAIAYSAYPQIMINGFEAQDTTGGKKVVYCVYTGYAHVYDEPFGWIHSPGGTLSREHTYAHSWYPTHPSQSGVEYSDFFNLFPVHQNNANARRSNHPLGNVQNVSYQFLDGKLGTDVLGNTVYEPRDSHKGDAARALFYMVLRYHNWAGNEWYLPPQQDQDILKLWHFTDPPDAWEKARNDYIHSRQGNRNPFIDSIHFITKIDFKTMEWLRIEQIDTPNLKASIFPNPARDYIQLELHVLSPGKLKATLFSLTGIPVKSIERNMTAGYSFFQIELRDLPKSAYILNVIFNDKTHSIKVIKH